MAPGVGWEQQQLPPLQPGQYYQQEIVVSSSRSSPPYHADDYALEQQQADPFARPPSSEEHPLVWVLEDVAKGRRSDVGACRCHLGA